MAVTFAERFEAYRKRGVSPPEARRLANIDKLRDSIDRDKRRIEDIDRVLPTLEGRDRDRLSLQRLLIKQFMDEDMAQLRQLKDGVWSP